MTNRVSVADVRAIIETGLEADAVSACISTANSLIAAKPLLSELAVETLTAIELWLSAHFVALADPRVVEEATRELRVKYAQGQSGKGLESTTYGQTALALDSTYSLADGTGVRRASLRFL